MRSYYPGGLYNGLTFDEVMTGHSKIRNKAIANIFSQMGLVESWGSGIKRIVNEADEYGLESPVFQEFDNMFRVSLYRKTAVEQEMTQNPDIKENMGEDKAGDKAGDKITISELNKTQEKILDALIEDNKLSAIKLAERLQLNGRYIERNIKKLKEAGILIRHGSPKAGYWEVIWNPEKEEKDNF